ncbi:MAG: phosphoglycolate phosphatase [Alphaproteobacteria bacterium]|nr:phosphoglycolate phosphatase [Alphaproteobacteria bacterium]
MDLPVPRPDRRTDTLVFDLDGTLVDSLADLGAAINRLLSTEARPPLSLARIRGFIGDGVPKLLARSLSAAGLSPSEDAFEALLARYTADYEARAAELTRPYPGVAELLPALAERGWRLAVCTNKPQAATLHVLKALGLARNIAVVAGGDRYPHRKPDPRHPMSAVAEAASAPARAVMIGDGPQDLAAGEAAGMRRIAALYGYGGLTRENIGEISALNAFTDLPAVLELAMR